jgi:regulator of sigma E protease
MLDLPNWLFVIPILGSLVLVHEFGHFITAKIFNIKVTEFGFGFPPKIWGYKKGETTYTINLIPIGGFVKMVGEEDSTDPRSFAAQSIMKRLIVLAAGPVMNLLTAIVIFIVLLMIPHETYVGNIVVTNIAPNSPAMNSNLQVGDNILTPRSNPPKLKVVDIVSDSTKEVSYTDAQTYDQNLKIGDTMTQGSLGVIIGLSNPKIIEEQLPIWKAIPESFGQLSNILTLTFSGLANWSQSGEDPGFTGPIGIAQITGEVAKIGYNPLFELTALISISLGILNLLPIPALDGGRITFILIEAARGGKRISAKIEGIIHMTGFAVLISLIILMSYFDLARILTGGNIIN